MAKQLQVYAISRIICFVSIALDYAQVWSRGLNDHQQLWHHTIEELLKYSARFWSKGHQFVSSQTTQWYRLCESNLKTCMIFPSHKHFFHKDHDLCMLCMPRSTTWVWFPLIRYYRHQTNALYVLCRGLFETSPTDLAEQCERTICPKLLKEPRWLSGEAHRERFDACQFYLVS